MRAFYADPSSLADVTQVIHTAKSILSTTCRDLELQLWEENDVFRQAAHRSIFEGIAKADIFIADITAMNFNVTFEIGYAIGLGKGSISPVMVTSHEIALLPTELESSTPLGLRLIPTRKNCRN